MTVRLEYLQRAFGAENALPLSFWTYSTVDPLEEVLAKGYFRQCMSQFRLGDLVICATDEPTNRHDILGKRDRRRVLLMVTLLDWRGIETRVVQDWGSPERSAAAIARRQRKPALRIGPRPALVLPAKRPRAVPHRRPRRQGMVT